MCVETQQLAQNSSDALMGQMTGPHMWSGKDDEQRPFDFLDSVMSPNKQPQATF